MIYWDLWKLPNEISSKTNYQYIIDIIDHFTKWYFGYLLHSKEAKEVLNKIDNLFNVLDHLKLFNVTTKMNSIIYY